MVRLQEYLAWAAGLMPNYRPSRGDLMLFAQKIGRPEPLAIVGVPVRK